MDEFENILVIRMYEKIEKTLRSIEIKLNILLQNYGDHEKLLQSTSSKEINIKVAIILLPFSVYINLKLFRTNTT